MAIFTLMRLSRVQLILDAEPLFKDLMAEPRVLVSSRNGKSTLEVVPFSIRVCRALIDRGFDPHNVDRTVVIACAATVHDGQVIASDELPPLILRRGQVAAKVKAKVKVKKAVEKPFMKTTQDLLKERHAVVAKSLKTIQEDIEQLMQQRLSLDDSIEQLKQQRTSLDAEECQLGVLLRLYSEGRIDEIGALFKKEPAAPANAPLPSEDEPLPPEPYEDELPEPLPPEPPDEDAPPKDEPPLIISGRKGDREQFEHYALRPRLIQVLNAMKKTGSFRLCDFRKFWQCDRCCVYIREFAKVLPYRRPLLLPDGLTFFDKATPDDIEFVAGEVCQMPWPKYLSKHTFEEVRAMALENMRTIRNTGMRGRLQRRLMRRDSQLNGGRKWASLREAAQTSV